MITSDSNTNGINVVNLAQQLQEDADYMLEVEERCKQLQLEIVQFRTEVANHELHVARAESALDVREGSGTAEVSDYLDYIGGELLLQLRRAELARLEAELVEANARRLLEVHHDRSARYAYPIADEATLEAMGM